MENEVLLTAYKMAYNSLGNIAKTRLREPYPFGDAVLKEESLAIMRFCDDQKDGAEGQLTVGLAVREVRAQRRQVIYADDSAEAGQPGAQAATAPAPMQKQFDKDKVKPCDGFKSKGHKLPCKDFIFEEACSFPNCKCNGNGVVRYHCSEDGLQTDEIEKYHSCILEENKFHRSSVKHFEDEVTKEKSTLPNFKNPWASLDQCNGVKPGELSCKFWGLVPAAPVVESTGGFFSFLTSKIA